MFFRITKGLYSKLFGAIASLDLPLRGTSLNNRATSMHGLDLQIIGPADPIAQLWKQVGSQFGYEVLFRDREADAPTNTVWVYTNHQAPTFIVAAGGDTVNRFDELFEPSGSSRDQAT